MRETIGFVVFLLIGILVDVILTPAILAVPALMAIKYVPSPWNVAGIALFMIPGTYVLAYMFIRDTDPAWPVGPWERFVFRDQ